MVINILRNTLGTNYRYMARDEVVPVDSKPLLTHVISFATSITGHTGSIFYANKFPRSITIVGAVVSIPQHSNAAFLGLSAGFEDE